MYPEFEFGVSRHRDHRLCGDALLRAVLLPVRASPPRAGEALAVVQPHLHQHRGEPQDLQRDQKEQKLRRRRRRHQRRKRLLGW